MTNRFDSFLPYENEQIHSWHDVRGKESKAGEFKCWHIEIENDKKIVMISIAMADQTEQIMSKFAILIAYYTIKYFTLFVRNEHFRFYICSLFPPCSH